MCIAIVWDAIVLGKQGGKLSADNYVKAIYLGSIIWRQFSGWQLFGGNYQYLIILWGTSLSFTCSRANYPGTITGEAIFQGAIIQGAIIMGVIIRGVIVRGANVQGEIVRGEIIRGAVVRGAIIQGEIILGGNCLGDNCPSGNCSGGNYLGGNCPEALVLEP